MYGRDSSGYAAFRGESAEWFEVGGGDKPDCSRIDQLKCQELPAERPIVPAGNPEGGLINRTEGDPDQNLSLQFTDYDVNAWRANEKERHRRGLERIIKFIQDRNTQILKSREGIAITISGAASRTGTKEYNDRLSCKRAACVAGHIRQILPIPPGGSDALLAKIHFDVSGKGFQEATCVGAQCEIGEFRSVLVAVHRPGKPPKPIDVIPPVQTKFRIRTCSLKTESLGEFLIGDLVDRGIAALPESIRKEVERSAAAKSLLNRLAKELVAQLKKALTRLPGALGRLAKELTKKLPFPVEFVRDTAVFQIEERDKPNPKDIILCYTGFGLRLLFPRELPVLIPEPLKKTLKEFLKKTLKVEGSGIDVLLDVLGGKIPSLDSKIPGDFTNFDVAPSPRALKPFTLQSFEGDAVLLKGGDLPGHVRLGFDSRRTFRHPDPVQRPRLVCKGCTESIIPVKVGAGTGIEVVAPTSGTLVDGSCVCGEAPKQVRAGFRQPVQTGIRPRVAVRRRAGRIARPTA